MDFSRLKHGVRKLQAANMKSNGGVLPPSSRVLPPIASTSSNQQQQQQSGLPDAACPSSSSLADVIGDPVLQDLLLGDRVPPSGFLRPGAPRPLRRRDLTGFHPAHPLKPLFHSTVSSGNSLAPFPPAVAKEALSPSAVATDTTTSVAPFLPVVSMDTTGGAALSPSAVAKETTLAQFLPPVAMDTSVVSPVKLRARRCGKPVLDAPRTPSGRLNNHDNSCHDNSCQGDSKLEQDRREDGDAMQRSLAVLNRMKDWIREERRRVDQEARLADIDLRSLTTSNVSSSSFSSSYCSSGRSEADLRSSALPPPQHSARQHTLPSAGTTSTLAYVPAPPPQAAKPQAAANRRQSRVPRFQKTAGASLASAVEGE